VQAAPRRLRSKRLSALVTSDRSFAALVRLPALLDVAIAVAALAGSLSLIRHGGSLGPVAPGASQLDAVSIALAACSTVPLVAWRRFPLGVFALTSVACVLLVGLGYRIDLLLGPAVALYLLAASRKPKRPWTRGMTAAVLGLFAAYLLAAAAAQRAVPGSELLHTGLAWAGAWFAGERTRLRREQIEDLRAHAQRAAREAERERLLAAAEERARIARDLHDSAGHAISLIAVRAGASRLRHRQDPERSLAALEAIEELARQTAAEIDAMVGSLREGGSGNDAAVLPVGLVSLDRLTASHREAGLDVTVDASGTPRRLGAAADQAAFRILQEALTNAARHGTGSARVGLVFADDWLELTVINPVPYGLSPPVAAGHGLVGMRERASLLGGTLEAGRVNGVFRVHARLAYGGHAA
jgi:signal transduction histidine kinase